jgi:hypothetical protein
LSWRIQRQGGNEPFDVLAPAPAARLADDLNRRLANVSRKLAR